MGVLVLSIFLVGIFITGCAYGHHLARRDYEPVLDNLMNILESLIKESLERETK